MTSRTVEAAAARSGIAVTARTLQDYAQMLMVSDDDISNGPILDCPGGASSFAAQARLRGGRVVSADPIYYQSGAAILSRVHASLDNAPAWFSENHAYIDWSYLGSVPAYVRASAAAADLFVADYTPESEDHVAAALPELPFNDDFFQLTLCSHLLFSHSETLTFDEHLAGLQKLCRVTHGEVRVFPVVNVTGAMFPRLNELRATLGQQGITIELRNITSSWLLAGKQMLVCRSD